MTAKAYDSEPFNTSTKGGRIRVLRKYRQWSRAELARQIAKRMSSMRRTRRLKPITRAAIRQWEVDGRNPVDENFFVLCELLQLPTFPAYFLQQFVLYGRPVPPEIAEFVQANNAPREHAPSTLRKD